jgi:hypothetical protein
MRSEECRLVGRRTAPQTCAAEFVKKRGAPHFSTKLVAPVTRAAPGGGLRNPWGKIQALFYCLLWVCLKLIARRNNCVTRRYRLLARAALWTIKRSALYCAARKEISPK